MNDNTKPISKRQLKIKLLFLLFIKFSISSAQFGSITGSVYSKSDKSPYPFVDLIAINEKHSGMGTSDFDGRFQIKPLVPGKYRVIAKCSGCKYSETTAIVLADKATPISLVIEQIKYNLVILEGINKNTAPEMIKNGVPIIFLFDSIKPKTCKENLVFEFIFRIRHSSSTQSHRIIMNCIYNRGDPSILISDMIYKFD